ncbi:unnamed protein product [Symbiodinium sp. CCMP2592]|nr:unnamed protein product [Symbiodinium sp. CCMP2592]
MQGCTFIGKVLLAALAVLADVLNGEHLTNASCANDDDQALVQARVKHIDVPGIADDITLSVCSPDQTPPVLVVPSDITFSNDLGKCEGEVPYKWPSATDFCDPAPSVVQTAGLGSAQDFPVGITTETFEATDASGNTATASFTVTVNDRQNPKIWSVPANIIVDTAPGQCDAVVTFAAPTFSDNCPGATIALTSGLSSGAAFPVGSTTETFTATDASGNTDSESFTVTVNDNEDPVPVLPADIVVSSDPGVCGAVVTYPVDATDNCQGATIALTSGSGSGAVFSVGSATTETYTATDAAGNTASGSFTVTVNDNENPVISDLPADITVGNDPGLCVAVVSYPAPNPPTDNCPGGAMALTSGLGSGAAFPVGSTTETFTATDASGNTDSESFTVTVNDNEDPVPVLPADIVVSSDPGVCGAVVTYPVDATDNCQGATIALTSGSGSGAVFSVGSATTETYTATDAAGNTASGSFTVTVNDNENPVISDLPADITVGNDPGLCVAVVSYPAPNPPTDNCPGGAMALTSGLGSGAAFPVGSTTETFTATDASGNTDSESFTVTVNDNEDPVPVLPADIVVSSDPGVCGAVVTYPVDATDNCQGATIALTSGSGSGAVFSVGPATTETYTATDAAGNTASGSFTVTVNDNENPVISGLPADITVGNDPGLCVAVVSYPAPNPPTDNCPGGAMALTSGLGSGAAFPVGSTTETFTATDASGNTDSESFTVTVNDNEDPVPVLPADIAVSSDPGVCGAVVTYPVDATDNCQGATIALTSGSGSGAVFSVGSATTETYTATDAAGNTASGSFTVTVNDNEHPALDVEDINVQSCSPTAVTFSPTATDNCQGVTSACSPSSGSEFAVGETQVTCTAVDAAGSTTQESFVVLVECVGHGYHKKSHRSNMRSPRNRRLKKWLHRNRRLKKWWHRNRRLKKWSHYGRYWHHRR